MGVGVVDGGDRPEAPQQGFLEPLPLGGPVAPHLRVIFGCVGVCGCGGQSMPGVVSSFILCGTSTATNDRGQHHHQENKTFFRSLHTSAMTVLLEPMGCIPMRCSSTDSASASMMASPAVFFLFLGGIGGVRWAFLKIEWPWADIHDKPNQSINESMNQSMNQSINTATYPP